MTYAQFSSCATAAADAVDLIKKTKAAPKEQEPDLIHDALSNVNLIAAWTAEATATETEVATAKTKAAITKGIEAKRTDVQSGASAGASGTTTAVSSASKPNFLGLALQNGATTQSTTGTSSTISFNPWNFVDSIAHDERQTLDPNDEGSRILRKLAFSVTLNTGGSAPSSKQTTTSSGVTPTTLVTQLKEVSAFTAHLDIHNDRYPMSGGAAKTTRKQVVPASYFRSADTIAQFQSDDSANEETRLATFKSDIETEVNRYM